MGIDFLPPTPPSHPVPDPEVTPSSIERPARSQGDLLLFVICFLVVGLVWGVVGYILGLHAAAPVPTITLS